jgi:hypothetical protein
LARQQADDAEMYIATAAGMGGRTSFEHLTTGYPGDSFYVLTGPVETPGSANDTLIGGASD